MSLRAATLVTVVIVVAAAEVLVAEVVGCVVG